MNTIQLEHIYNVSAMALLVTIYSASCVFLLSWLLNLLFDNEAFLYIVNTTKKWVYVFLSGVTILAIVGLAVSLLYFESH